MYATPPPEPPLLTPAGIYEHVKPVDMIQSTLEKLVAKSTLSAVPGLTRARNFIPADYFPSIATFDNQTGDYVGCIIAIDGEEYAMDTRDQIPLNMPMGSTFDLHVKAAYTQGVDQTNSGLFMWIEKVYLASPTGLKIVE